MQPTEPFTPEWLPAPPPPAGPARDRGSLLGKLVIGGMLRNMVNVGLFVLAAGAAGGIETASTGVDPSKVVAAQGAQRAFHLLVVLSLGKVAGLTGVWMWKRWGVYLYAFVAAFGILIAMRVSRANGYVSLVWTAALFMCVIPRWRSFE